MANILSEKDADGEKEDWEDENRSPLVPRRRRKGQKRGIISTSHYWADTLNALPPDFFTCEEDLMKVESKIKQSVAAYVGVTLDERNSEDMKRIYETVFSTRATLGHTLYTYDQFKSTIGQFARMFISFGLTDGCELYQKGKLYRCVTQIKPVQTFLSYFQVRSASSTVGSKSRHLNRLAEHAITFLLGETS